MFKEIIKRDGRVVPFDPNKITEAIFKAARAVGGEDRETALKLTLQVLGYLKAKYNGNLFNVEDVQDAVEKILIENGHAKTAKAYILYRAKRTAIREGKSELMDTVAEILVETSRENANIGHSPAAKMYQIASAASKHYYLSRLIPEELALLHKRGDYHIHDLDYYAKTINCLQHPLKEILEKGFNNGHGYIRPPKRPGSAAALAAIVLQSAQNDMYGGQSFPFFDRDMAAFMGQAPEEEIFQAMEAFIYNLNSMHSRAGNQVVFSSINLGTDTSEAGRKVTRNFLLAYERGLGRGENPIFPNIIFRLKKGVNFEPGDPNYDLFQLALRVAAKRLNPTFSFMDSSFNQKYGDQVSYMGCRTRVMANRKGPEVTERRGNIAAVTLNLPRLAIKARGNLEVFWQELFWLMEMGKQQLLHRLSVLKNLKVKDLPFIMGQKIYLGSENLGPEDSILPAIVHGTFSIGFIGLAETLILLTGKHHGESEEAQELGLKIVKAMREKVDEFCEETDLNFALLATPAEGLSGRFTALDRKEFGVIPGVTDKQYYTNSFHVPVAYPIEIFRKIEIEGPYHKYCNGGHISYVEFSAPPLNNVEALEAVIRHMAKNDMGYAGINYPLDFCENCGFLGVIDDLCPACGEGQIRRVRRITGYLSTVDRFNDAKLAELYDRRPHGVL
ncbi:anaerobic ribonucleoside-triphosphate reductase [Carboxydothermus ferrireducens]|uniref:Ribonucleoside-triphosphate reductase n=1 Tax=Carboxydothermus ferrireducens DSM 11255 TaxID=1119529 RepID=A0ABX2RD23_9THEO|nr:anaerobic ribonucleoside-triphosphate reductase [Carboxydothermus ferrireducens]NYE58764.1 ribonucleoside-triphosphate reductase [Carboxydothermus ferrireducens DSM 11255]